LIMSAIDQLGGVLHAESCEVSLDYAYYHVVWNLALVVLLVRTARTEHFLCAHLFGLFALWIDYGVFYLTQETRTVSYGEGVTPLGPLGTFLFFAWFDHFGAWGLIVWARTCEDAIRAWREKLRPISKVDVLVLLHQPGPGWRCRFCCWGREFEVLKKVLEVYETTHSENGEGECCCIESHPTQRTTTCHPHHH
jgi:hypothetical protein